MCSQDSGEQSKYCWSKDNWARAPSLQSENQAGGSESWNFKNSHPEGVKPLSQELLSQGPAQAMSTPPVEQLSLEKGLAPTLGSVQISRLTPCLCPVDLHPFQARRTGAPLAVPSA